MRSARSDPFLFGTTGPMSGRLSHTFDIPHRFQSISFRLQYSGDSRIDINMAWRDTSSLLLEYL